MSLPKLPRQKVWRYLLTKNPAISVYIVTALLWYCGSTIYTLITDLQQYGHPTPGHVILWMIYAAVIVIFLGIFYRGAVMQMMLNEMQGVAEKSSNRAIDALTRAAQYLDRQGDTLSREELEAAIESIKKDRDS